MAVAQADRGGAAPRRHGRAPSAATSSPSCSRTSATCASATIVAERLQETLVAPFHVDDRELYVSASIGIALATADRAPEDVVRDADVAMYRAKAEGGARHAVFDEAMHARVMQRLDLETGLRHALERAQLRVLYQPMMRDRDRQASPASRRSAAGRIPPARRSSHASSCRSPTRPG